MLTVGIDAHKRVHVAVVLDDAGRELGAWRGPNNAPGWAELLTWAKAFGGELVFGVEGAWGYGRGLAQSLIRAGDTVYEVNARWTANARAAARRQSKTDRLDATAVAVILRRERAGLTPLSAEDDTAVLNLLSVERDAALVDATRLRNQLHAQLMQLDPEYQRYVPGLRSKAAMVLLKEFSVTDADPCQVERAAIVRRLAQRLELAFAQADECAERIRALASTRFEPLTRICGVNLLTAGALAGVLGPGRRFATDAELAAYAGVAPLEASSGDRVRHRLNRTGNRRLNAIIYRIAISQARHSAEAQAYLARRVAGGKTRREAHRALRRYIVRAVFRRWAECQLTSDDLADHAPCASFACT
jgi:transposase